MQNTASAMENPTTATSEESREAATAVESIKNIKIPQFWQQDPKLWFAQVEAQFHKYNVRSDSAKYFTVIGALDCSVLQQVSDLLDNPPLNNRYATIKSRLVTAYSESNEKQLRKLLTELELGDQRPTQLLRYMRSLAAEKMSEDVLKTLWLQRMPTNVQMVLSASEGVELSKMAAIADKILEVNVGNFASHSMSINAIASSAACASASPPTNQTISTTNAMQGSTPATSPELAVLHQQIASLTKMVEELRTDQQRSRNFMRSRSRSHSRARSSNNGECFYHRRFGSKARKCTPPCTYNSSAGNESSRRQ